MTEPNGRRADLTAAVEARRELGPEYEGALIEGFLERLDRERLDTDRRLEARRARPRSPSRRPRDPGLILALGSLGLGIPLSGIADRGGNMSGLLITWMGIVAVNAAHAWGRRHDVR